MRFVLSVEAEQELERIENGDQSQYELVEIDLQLLEILGVDSVELGPLFGQWVLVTGPTGRVSYWVSPDDDDLWLIESIDVH